MAILLRGKTGFIIPEKEKQRLAERGKIPYEQQVLEYNQALQRQKSAGGLPPILDIAGRPLVDRVGTPRAEAQLIEAGKIYQAEASKQRQAQALTQQRETFYKRTPSKDELQLLPGLSILGNTSILPNTGLFDTSDTRRPSRGTSTTYGRVIVPKVEYKDEFQQKVESGEYTKQVIPGDKTAFGMGSRIVYVDANGTIVGEERKVLEASTQGRGFVSSFKETKLFEGLSLANTGLSNMITPIITPVEKAVALGIDTGLIGLNIPMGKTGRELQKGIVVGTLEDIRINPGKNIVIYGATVGLGFAFKGLATGLASIPRVGSILSGGTKVAGYGAGLGLTTLYGAETYAKVMQTPGAYAKGSIIGVSAKDLSLAGFGFARGEKGFVQLKGLYETSGKTFLETKQGDYPSAPSKVQLNLFQKNIYPQLGKEAGAFHTTSAKFWNDSISPKSGTSELAGLYGSTQVSRPFAKIQGKGSGYSLFPNIKELVKPETTPGIAFLKPQGFRNVDISLSKTKLFEGQKYLKGRGYASFTELPKAGFMDIPKNFKSEIEAIARPGAGKYSLESKDFYTKINGVRVSIDTAKYSGGKNKLNIEGFGKGKGKIVDLGSYSLPSSKYSITNVGMSLPSLYKSSKGYGRSSAISSVGYPKSSTKGYGISSITPSYSGRSYGRSGKSAISYLSSYSPAKSYGGSSYGYGKSGGRSYSRGGLSYTSTGKKGFGMPSLPKSKGGTGGIYGVQTKRYGKWFSIGSNMSLGKAIGTGRNYTSGTLARSFQVTKQGKAINLPTLSGFYKSKKGSVQIEKSRYSLSRPMELFQIQSARKRKRK